MILNKKSKLLFGLLTLTLCSKLFAPLKNNLSGTSYARAENNRSTTFMNQSPWTNTNKTLKTEYSSLIISLQAPYIVPADLLSQTLGTGSSLTRVNAGLTLEAGTELSVTSTISTKKSVHCGPGQEVIGTFAAAFPSPNASGGHYTRYIGIFNANEGVAIGTRNSTFGILYLQNGIASFTAQNNFNIDPLDGSGPSGFTLDRTKLNLYYINFSGNTYTIEFGITTEQGVPLPFHTIRYPNLYSTPIFYNTSLPISFAVSKNLSGPGALNIINAMSNVKIIGSEQPTRLFSTSITNKTVSTITPVITLKNKTSFNSTTNRTKMRLIHTNISGYTSGNFVRVYLHKNSTFFFNSFTDVNSSYSVAESDTLTNSLSMNGDLIFQTGAYSQGSNDIFFKINGINIEIYPGETLTLSAEEGGVGGVTLDYCLTWEEIG